jgi:hypothetical protein
MGLSFHLTWSVCPQYTNTLRIGDLQDAVLACANATFIWTWTGGSLSYYRLSHITLSNSSYQQNLLFIYDQKAWQHLPEKLTL